MSAYAPITRLIAPLALLLWVTGCAQLKETGGAISDTFLGTETVEFISVEADDDAPAETVEARAERVTQLKPDQQCSVPQEEYEYSAVLVKHFGREADLRMKTLLATEFTKADLTREQKRMLKTLAKETLWIPAAAESLLGDVLFRAEKAQLKSIPKEGAREKYWTYSQQVFGQLLTVAPRMPYDVEFTILQDGTPRALAGGRIFIDQETVRESVQKDTPAERAKLTFLYAHELAHVFKRHKTKRIQQLLIETDDGLKLARELMTGLEPSGEIDPMAWVSNVYAKMQTIDRMVETLKSNHAEFTREQEFEADACAAVLMIAADLGDPLRGFNTYAQAKKGAREQTLSPYDLHPPHPNRANNISKVKRKSQRALKMTSSTKR